MYLVKVYNASFYQTWNTFISNSKNGTFLFHRDFMEYHNDRFQDFSLLIYKEDTLVAVLPANSLDKQIFSHQGLTYGGLVYSDKLKLASIILIFESILKFLHLHNFNTFSVKQIPSIYQSKPSEEMDYILFLLNAKLLKRDALSVIDLREPFLLSKDRKKGLKRGVNSNLKIIEESKFDFFWENILIPNLKEKHQIVPVHNVEEIKMLQRKFPDNIRHFNVYYQNNIVAGTTIFETQNVAHSQYIASNETKNELGSLDFLHHYLLTEIFKEKKYFDFGISNENQGRNLNQGLSYWKESFGANTIVHNFYEVEIKNYILLENVLI